MLLISCYNAIFAYYNMQTMKRNILITFGQNVQRLRKERKLSQERLAELANLHRTYIGMIERAEKNITLLNIEKIVNALGVEIKNLF